MSETHYDGQRLAECDCGRTIRLKAERNTANSQPAECVCGAVLGGGDA